MKIDRLVGKRRKGQGEVHFLWLKFELFSLWFEEVKAFKS